MKLTVPLHWRSVRRGQLVFALPIVCVALCGIWAAYPAPLPLTATKIFDSDPNHIWNRTYACLFVRQGPDGTEYGTDTPDPLLWAHTRYLMSGESHRKAIACLDKFLSSHAEGAMRDPLKRAILQHDLWAVFDRVNQSWDWANRRKWPANDKQQLEIRLAKVISRLALTPEQIRGLPDAYAAAVNAQHFAADYNSQTPQQPFLPTDFFQAGGPWVCLSAYSDQPTAATHFSGRSRFLVFMRLPGGRDATLNYLREVRSSREPPLLPDPNGSQTLNLKLPQFPPGTQVALVRQAILIDRDGKLVPTELTEDLQLRVYHTITPGERWMNFQSDPSSHDQDVFEFRMSRPNLFMRQDGGLVAVTPGETDYPTFSTQGMDPFEFRQGGRPIAVLGHCLNCHSGSGIHSVQSRVQWIEHWQHSEQAIDEGRDPIEWETDATIARKYQSPEFVRLQTFWHAAGN